MFSNIWQPYYVMKDLSKVTKMHFWMIQRTKKEIFGHFLGLGLLDQLDIAYYDSTKCFPTFTRSLRIIQISQKYLFEWPKEPKNRFLAVLGHYFLSKGLLFFRLHNDKLEIISTIKSLSRFLNDPDRVAVRLFVGTRASFDS